MIHNSPPENFSSRYYVVSCFVEHAGRLLFLKRNSDKDEGDKWGTVAGKVDDGETPEQAIVRELAEETGIAIEAADLDRSKLVYIRYPEYDYEFHMFSVSLHDEPRVLVDEREHQGYCWLTREKALKDNLVLATDECIRAFYK